MHGQFVKTALHGKRSWGCQARPIVEAIRYKIRSNQSKSHPRLHSRFDFRCENRTSIEQSKRSTSVKAAVESTSMSRISQTNKQCDVSKRYRLSWKNHKPLIDYDYFTMFSPSICKRNTKLHESDRSCTWHVRTLGRFGIFTRTFLPSERTCVGVCSIQTPHRSICAI